MVCFVKESNFGLILIVIGGDALESLLVINMGVLFTFLHLHWFGVQPRLFRSTVFKNIGKCLLVT